MTRFSRLATFLIALAFTPQIANAGVMELADRGDNYAPDTNGNPGDGQMWPNFPTSVLPLAGSIPFALDFGTGAIANRTYLIDLHGQVLFTTDISGTSTTGDFVKILYNSTPGDNGKFAPPISVTGDLGLIDPSLIDKTLAPHFDDKSKGLQAYRFFFNQVCPTNASTCSSLDFQAVFLRLTDNAFVLEFNYGGNSFSSIDPVSLFSAGFQIGSNPLTDVTGFSSAGPDFCFKNGVASPFRTIAECAGSTTAAVPEPGVGPLLLLGGLVSAAGGLTRRRRRMRRATN